MHKLLCLWFVLAMVPCHAFAQDDDSKRTNKQRIERALLNLDSTNYAMAEAAIYKLEQMSDHAIPYLIREMREDDLSKRKLSNIIYTLGRIGPRAKITVPLLTSFLSHESNDIRAISVIALGKIGRGAQDAVPKLVKLQYDPHEWISESAQKSLKSINTKEARRGLKEFKLAHQ